MSTTVRIQSDPIASWRAAPVASTIRSVDLSSMPCVLAAAGLAIAPVQGWLAGQAILDDRNLMLRGAAALVIAAALALPHRSRRVVGIYGCAVLAALLILGSGPSAASPSAQLKAVTLEQTRVLQLGAAGLAEPTLVAGRAS